MEFFFGVFKKKKTPVNKCFPYYYMWSLAIYTICAWYRLLSTGQHWADMVWKMSNVLPSGAFEYFPFLFVAHISVYNMFLILLLSRYVGNRSSLSWNKKFTVLFFPCFWAAYMCVTLWSLLPWAHSPCGFPQTIGYCCWIPYLWTSGVGKHVWRRQIGRWWWEQLVKERLICFSLLFFPRPCRPFSSHLCFLHMKAVVRSPE